MTVDKQKSLLRRSGRYISGMVMLVAVGAGLFWIAGRWDWWQGWAFLSFFAVYVNALSIWLARTNPELYAERSRIAENVEPWDKVVIRIYNLGLFSLLGIAALDSGRFAWSVVPWAIQMGGWIGLCFAAMMIWHVLATNDFSSSWARIQEDRQQVVVSSGAYSWVRHPMYLGVSISVFSVPLVLGSYWALIPGLAVAMTTIYRTAREDRMLIDKLPGYKAFAAIVRYRLFPGVW